MARLVRDEFDAGQVQLIQEQLTDGSLVYAVQIHGVEVSCTDRQKAFDLFEWLKDVDNVVGFKRG
jgi:hypothetical protein